MANSITSFKVVDRANKSKAVEFKVQLSERNKNKIIGFINFSTGKRNISSFGRDIAVDSSVFQKVCDALRTLCAMGSNTKLKNVIDDSDIDAASANNVNCPSNNITVGKWHSDVMDGENIDYHTSKNTSIFIGDRD